VLNDPAMQAGVLPLLVALALAGFIRVIGGPERGPRLIGVAVVASFLFSLTLSAGVPPLPPPSPAQHIFYLAILGAAAGFALDMAERPVRPQETLRVVVPGLTLLWLAWGHLAAGVALAELATLAALWGGGTLVLVRLERAETQAGGLSAAVMLVAAALGVAGIASLGASSAVALSAVALAAAAGGLALWGYGVWLIKKASGPFGATTLFGGGAGLLGMAYVLVLFSPQASRVALVILLLVFFADTAAARIRLGGTLRSRIMGPILFATLAAIPALVAVGYAVMTSGG
jgi:hypothetical protein